MRRVIGDRKVGRASGRSSRRERYLLEVGDWSWQQNPFVGTAPYQGLLVVLLLFNSSDIKNANNSVYQLLEPREGATRWLVVRDIGASLGETGRLDPKRGDPDLFDRIPFITGVRDGFVDSAIPGGTRSWCEAASGCRMCNGRAIGSDGCSTGSGLARSARAATRRRSRIGSSTESKRRSGKGSSSRPDLICRPAYHKVTKEYETHETRFVQDLTS